MLHISRRTAFGVLMMLVAGINSQGALAHSEKEKARFVAENGVDTGACNNRFRPCKSIAYAVQQANKGDNILVAQGQYRITSEQELLYLVSELQPVLGGFDTLDNYQIQQPDRFNTVLVGVPPEYADALYQKGFSVISDSKGIDETQLAFSLDAIELMNNAQPAAECVDGNAGGFECSNLSLLSHVPLSSMPTNSNAANDIWGHVDLNDMREYAIIGLRRGIAVVDVTNAENPDVIGSVSGQSTTWRDIKVFQYYSNADRRWKAYAYAGADAVNEGLTIIDLNNLPNSIELVTRTTDDASAHNVYISNVDYTTNTALSGRAALLHATGTDNFGGAWRTFELKNPRLPAASYELESATRSDYTHDASSLLIDDGRADRDCVNAQNGICNVMLDFNESELRLWDHSSSTSATELGSESYPNAAYVHSGWWSEDKQYVILHDELDEQRFGLNSTVHFFDISDLNSPTLVSSWVGPTRAIDHNGFVRGNRYYMSNYERGVTVLDISDPLNPQQVGFFDTFGSSNNPSFNGTWGVYPYLPSGIILASDIQGGLYVLKDETQSTSDNLVGFSQQQFSGSEGSELALTVEKSGSQSMSVDYHIIYGSARSGDVSFTNGTLNWSNGDSVAKTIPMTLSTDNNDEPDELLFVRLSNPQGGAITVNNTAFVTIAGEGIQRGVIGFEQASAEVKEIDGSVSFSLFRNGGSDSSVSVNYAVSAGNATVGDDLDVGSGTVSWADGDADAKTITLTIVDDTENEGDETFTISLSASDAGLLAETSSLAVTLRDDEANQAPTADAGADRNVNTRQSVALTATGADPEEKPLTFSWQQTAGSTVTLQNADSLTPSFTAPASAGSLTLELTVTDDFGVSATDSVTITVNAPTTTPTPSSDGGSGGSMPIIWTVMLALGVAVRRAKLKTVRR